MKYISSKNLFYVIIALLALTTQQAVAKTITIRNLSPDPISVFLHPWGGWCTDTMRFDLQGFPDVNVQEIPGTAILLACGYSSADFYHYDKHYGSADLFPSIDVASSADNVTLWINNSDQGRWGIGCDGKVVGFQCTEKKPA